jgi:flagellar motor switch protein FliN/FliY
VADESDDLQNPNEIEALLESNAAKAQQSSQPAQNAGQGEQTAAQTGETPTGAASDSPSENLDPGSVDALSGPGDSGGKSADPAAADSASPQETVEQLLDQAEAGLASAVADGNQSPRGIPAELGTPKPFELQSFDTRDDANGGRGGLPALQDVELDMQIELGRTELLIEEVLKLKEGSVVPLDKLAGDPVDIIVNGRLIARGEVLVLNDNFCVRVAEILTPEL